MTASRSGPIAILTAAMLGLIPAETAAEPPVPPGWTSADLAAYGYAAHKVWNCNADVPESLDKEAESHSYRLRFGFGLDPSMQIQGAMDVYQSGGSAPVARYPLTGRAYHGWQNAPAVLLEFGPPSHGDTFPDWADWTGFRILSDLRAGSGGTFYLAAQIDRRSDNATWVNLTQCYAE